MWLCEHCKKEIKPLAVCQNPKCQKPTGFPVNVQLAAEAATALFEAFTTLLQEIGNDGSATAVFQEFSELFSAHFRVSMNVQPETLLSMLQDSRIRYTNLHDNLRANMVLDYDPELAAKRRGIDSLAFGSAGEKVTYGAVNLGNRGLVSYGSVCIFLRGDSIQLRTSFLEDNSFRYFSGKLPNIKFDLSAALRAVWDTVNMLVFVKHGRDINSGEMTVPRLADLILASSGDKYSDRFIEAQIFPPITMEHFQKVVYYPGLDRPRGADRVLSESAALSAELLDEAFHYKRLFAAKLGRVGIEFERAEEDQE
jgi:hypothetical protein